MSSEIEVTDVQQAKIVISMKNDEIKSLNNKMKMVQKKGNIKLAENNYQIQQLKNKIQDMEKNNDKLKQTHQLELGKFAENEDKLKAELAKQKQQINDMLKNQRQMQRAHKAHLYEQDLKLNEEKEKNWNLVKELKEILKLFNPKEIMQHLGLRHPGEITPYIKMYEEWKFKSDEVILLSHQLEQYKADTFQAMEESFSKLNSYEQVMDNLRQKNEELEEIMVEKEKHLEEKHYELEQKDNMLAQVQAFTTQKYTEMSNEIQSLRKSVQNYERESLNYNQSKQQHENNLKFIFELSSEFERKQEDYLNKITELELSFQTMQAQKEQLIKQYNEQCEKFKESNIKFNKSLERAEKNVKDKEEIIEMLSNSLKDLEGEYELTKEQLERNKLETGELIRRKHKLQEELKEKQTFYQSKEQSLLEEVELLRTYQHQDRISQDSDDRSFDGHSHKPMPMSLEEQLQPEPNWFEMYEACLQKHNKFIREVYFLLRKQQRKQSAQLEDLNA